jgi:hypothetical protein
MPVEFAGIQFLYQGQVGQQKVIDIMGNIEFINILQTSL